MVSRRSIPGYIDLGTKALFFFLVRGHASENPDLPAALADRNIRFLGPGSEAMAALGDKASNVDPHRGERWMLTGLSWP